MKTTENKQGQTGFTLLEVLIAVTLLAIGLLAVAAMQSVAINANGIANKSTVVTSLAQEYLENAMRFDRTDARLRGAGPMDNNVDVPNVGSYTVTTTIAPIASASVQGFGVVPTNSGGGSGLSRIDVTVRDNRTGVAVTVSSDKKFSSSTGF